jgi:CheY-like chemotaxis protein
MLLIALTGWSQERDRQEAFDAGFDHHLAKPVDYARLLSLLG